MQYDAFMSYSHAADGMLAPAIQKSLQNLAKPLYKLKALNIFRDETSLSLTPHLWRSIEKALSRSSYFILMASPEAMASKWVLKEIEWWLTNRSIDTILICLTEGEIAWDNVAQDFDYKTSTSIPQIFKGKFEMEAYYVDFRPFRSSEDLSLGNPDFKKSIAVLAASIHQKEPSALIGEDVAVQRRIIFLRNWALIILFALSLGVIGFAWISQMNLAKSRKNLATSLIANAKLVLERNPALSFRLAEEAYALDNKNPGAFALAFAASDRPMKTIFEGTWNIEGFSKDGRYVAYISYFKNGLHLMDLQTGEQLRPFVGYYLGFSPDNQFLTTYFADSVLLWDLRTGNRLNAFAAKYGGFTLYSKFEKHREGDSGKLWENPPFSPDGHFLVIYANDQVFFHDPLTGKPVQSFKGEFKGFSPNGRFLVTRTAKGEHLIWDLHSAKQMKWVGGNYLAFSPDSRLLATSSGRKTLLHNLQTGEQLQPFPGTYIGFSSDSVLLITHLQNTIKLWNIKTGKQFRSFIGEDLKFSPDNRFITIVTEDEIHVWDIRTNELLYKFGVEIKDEQINERHRITVTQVYREFNRIPFVCSFSPDGKYLLIESAYAEDWLFLLPPVQSQHILREHTGKIYDIEFDGNLLFTTSADSTARIWNIETGKIIDTLKHPDEVLKVVSLGSEFYTDCADGLQYNWDRNTGKPLGTEPSMYGMIHYSFPRNHYFEMNISPDKSAQLIDPTNYEPEFTFKQKRGKITRANISSGDHYVVTGSDDGTVIIYAFHPMNTFFSQSKNLLISKLDSLTAVRFGVQSGTQKVQPKNVNILQLE